MARDKKKRRKAYVPRPISKVGGLFAIGGMHVAAEDRRPLTDDDALDLGLAYRMSLEAMVSGESSEEHWSMVTCSLNVGLILCERGIGAEFERQFITALDGAFRAKLRAERTGSWRFDGDALNDIRSALEVHDEQIKITTKEEMRQALLEVRRRVKEGHTYREAA